VGRAVRVTPTCTTGSPEGITTHPSAVRATAATANGEVIIWAHVTECSHESQLLDPYPMHNICVLVFVTIASLGTRQCGARFTSALHRMRRDVSTGELALE
jgi:hypothetical protein